jgi:hypothetical protein
LDNISHPFFIAITSGLMRSRFGVAHVKLTFEISEHVPPHASILRQACTKNSLAVPRFQWVVISSFAETNLSTAIESVL